MSIANTAATTGAGPPAPINSDPGRHVASRPAAVRISSAAWTLIGSGPKRELYSAGVTVRPEAMSLASSSPLRTLRPRLRSTWVDIPDGPTFAACLIAVASGAGVAVSLLPGGTRFAVCVELQPATPSTATTASAAQTRALTGTQLPRPLTRMTTRIRACCRHRTRGCGSSRRHIERLKQLLLTASDVALRPRATWPGPCAGAREPCLRSSRCRRVEGGHPLRTTRDGRALPPPPRPYQWWPSAPGQAIGLSPARSRSGAKSASDRRTNGCGPPTSRLRRPGCHRAARSRPAAVSCAPRPARSPGGPRAPPRATARAPRAGHPRDRVSRRGSRRHLVDLWQRAPDSFLELGLDLVRLLQADITCQLRYHVRMDAVVPIAELNVDTTLHGWMRLHDLTHPLGELRAALSHVLASHDDRLHGLEVDVDARCVGQLRPQRSLQTRAGLRGRGQRHVAGELGMHRQVQRAVALPLDGHVVKIAHASVACGCRVNALDQVAGLRLAFDQDGELELG